MTRNGTKNVAQPPTAVRSSALGSFSRPRAGVPHSGFTLIEVLTAVALTAGLMLGVIEIFKMSTDSASQTEQASDAFEMGRGVMAQLESDTSMFAPEGYLSNSACMLGSYRFDNLAFSVALAAPTSAGLSYYNGSAAAQRTDPINSANLMAAGGQVVYTIGGRWQTFPASSITKSGWYVGTRNDSDPRGAVLVRKFYNNRSSFPSSTTYNKIFLGQGLGGTGGAPLIYSGISNGTALVQNTSMIQAATEYLTTTFNNLNWLNTPIYRLATVNPTSVPVLFSGTSVSSVPFNPIAPVINVPDPSAPYTPPTAQTNLDERDNVVCDRVSEFFVEVWNGSFWAPQMTINNGALYLTPYTFNGAGTPTPYCITTGGPIPGSAGGSWGTGTTNVASFQGGNMLWLGTAANPLNRYALTGLSTTAISLPPATTPSMIRVTLVVHPHADTTPLASEPYFAAGVSRYQGVVFREIFKLSGTVH